MAKSLDKLDPDLPISGANQDELSFLPFAEAVAHEIIAYDRGTSFIIGVNGPWGSGKTSLLALIIEKIKKTNDEVIHLPYSPWLVGNREDLLRDLLPQIVLKLENKIQKGSRKKDLESALKAVKRYSHVITAVEHGINMTAASATIFGFPVPIWLTPLSNTFGYMGRLFGLIPTCIDQHPCAH